MTPDDDSAPPPTDLVRVRRLPERARYDAETVHAVIDACLVAHVGTVNDGRPLVLPMFCVRDGTSILLHGAPAAGTVRRGAGLDVCAEMTVIDGLVLARSALHHSMNFRSVVVNGTAELITDRADKSAALETIVDRLVPGRSADLRRTTAKEEQGTAVLRLPLEHASVKIRTGPPVDDDDDYQLPIWAGVVPVTTVYGAPIDDHRLLDDIPVPQAVHELVARHSP